MFDFFSLKFCRLLIYITVQFNMALFWGEPPFTSEFHSQRACNAKSVFMSWCHHATYSHYNDVIMGAMASQITSLTIVYSTVYSGTDQRKCQSSASLAFVRGIHRWPVNSLHKGPVTRKVCPFDDFIICSGSQLPHLMLFHHHNIDPYCEFYTHACTSELFCWVSNP